MQQAEGRPQVRAMVVLPLLPLSPLSLSLSLSLLGFEGTSLGNKGRSYLAHGSKAEHGPGIAGISDIAAMLYRPAVRRSVAARVHACTPMYAARTRACVASPCSTSRNHPDMIERNSIVLSRVPGSRTHARTFALLPLSIRARDSNGRACFMRASVVACECSPMFRY
jgi:hypothetical protein